MSSASYVCYSQSNLVWTHYSVARPPVDQNVAITNQRTILFAKASGISINKWKIARALLPFSEYPLWSYLPVTNEKR